MRLSFWKGIGQRFVIASTINLFTLLISGVFLQSLAQSEISVTTGFVENNSSFLTSYEPLTLGREWSVYSIPTGQYLGNAKVLRSNPTSSKCSYKYTSQLISDVKVHEGQAFLLIRSSRLLPSRVRMSKTAFQQIPQSARQTILQAQSGWKLNYRELMYENFTIVNLDPNDSSNIILEDTAIRNARKIVSSMRAIYVRSGNQWSVRQQYTCDAVD